MKLRSQMAYQVLPHPVEALPTFVHDKCIVAIHLMRKRVLEAFTSHVAPDWASYLQKTENRPREDIAVNGISTCCCKDALFWPVFWARAVAIHPR